MQRLLKGFLRAIGIRSPQLFEQATEQDIYHCYRLLLKRTPDPAGWEYWKRTINQQPISVGALAASFLDGHEFARAYHDTSFGRSAQAARRVLATELNGFTLFFSARDHLIGPAIARDKAYEPHVTRELRALLRPGDVFLDIGANIGYFSLLAARLVGEHGKVIAFEPFPENCALLWLSILENGFTNIELYPNAADEQERIFELELDGANGRLIPEQRDDGIRSFEGHDGGPLPGRLCVPVRAVVLDTVLRDVARINVIKIDIEGAEPRALRGMRNLIERHRPVILTEFSRNMIPLTARIRPESYLDALRALGYELFVVESDTTAPLAPNYQEVEARYFATRLDHIDLIAYPAGRNRLPPVDEVPRVLRT